MVARSLQASQETADQEIIPLGIEWAGSPSAPCGLRQEHGCRQSDKIGGATEPSFQSTWFLVSVLTEIAVVLVLRTHLPCWRSRPSPLLLAATIAVGMLAVLLPYLPPTANAFSFVPIPLPLLLTSLLVVLAYVATADVAKRLFYGHPPPRPAA